MLDKVAISIVKPGWHHVLRKPYMFDCAFNTLTLYHTHTKANSWGSLYSCGLADVQHLTHVWHGAHSSLLEVQLRQGAPKDSFTCLLRCLLDGIRIALDGRLATRIMRH